VQGRHLIYDKVLVIMLTCTVRHNQGKRVDLEGLVVVLNRRLVRCDSARVRKVELHDSSWLRTYCERHRTTDNVETKSPQVGGRLKAQDDPDLLPNK
jgi:hypothetical protein